jgi:hypothetical protein
MRSPKNAPARCAIAGVSLILLTLIILTTTVILRAAEKNVRRSSTLNCSSKSSSEPQAELFFPLTAGNWWLYRGTVTWADQQTEKEVHAEVTLRMSVEKVIQKPEFTIAVLSGFPRDLDWATGEVPAMPWLLLETKRHEIFANSLPPDFDYAKLEKDAAALDKFLAEDNLLFRWPLKQGMKFGDAESIRRDDGHYCWVVTSQETRKLSDIKGAALKSAEVSVLQFITNPDDTEIEVSPGTGILSYQYHHHGTVAETSLTLVEFHAATTSPKTSGAKP